MDKRIQFQIVIDDNYQLRCSCIDSENKETIIYLKNNRQEHYPITISFNNKITICKTIKIYFLLSI